MSDQEQGAEDFASASIATPLPADDLLQFISNIERFYRLNPYLEIESFQ